MATVPVQKISDEKSLAVSWFDAIQKFSEQIRVKAFELFERSGRQDGYDVDHWLAAEQQLMSVPRTELNDTDAAFELNIDTPGFEARQIEVSALPDSILVKAESSQEQEKKEGDIRYTELRDQSLFRRIPLAKPVDINKVTAILDKGVLRIVAPKRVDGEARKAAGA